MSKITQSGETLFLFICISIETVLVASFASCSSIFEDDHFLRMDLTAWRSYSS